MVDIFYLLNPLSRPFFNYLPVRSATTVSRRA